MPVNHSTHNGSMGRAGNFVVCRRQDQYYFFFDKTDGTTIATVLIDPRADEELNSKYLAALTNAIYTYGKTIGFYQ